MIVALKLLVLLNTYIILGQSVITQLYYRNIKKSFLIYLLSKFHKRKKKGVDEVEPISREEYQHDV